MVRYNAHKYTMQRKQINTTPQTNQKKRNNNNKYKSKRQRKQTKHDNVTKSRRVVEFVYDVVLRVVSGIVLSHGMW